MKVLEEGGGLPEELVVVGGWVGLGRPRAVVVGKANHAVCCGEVGKASIENKQSRGKVLKSGW